MSVLPEDYKPTVDQLAAIMQARTYDGNGSALAGTFVDPTEDEPGTTPSATQAADTIDTALGLVAGRLGTVPDSLGDMATGIVALRAAMLVETSYFPNETGAEDSAYAAYRDQYREALTDYDAAIDRNVGEVQSARVASVAMLTHYTALPEDE